MKTRVSSILALVAAFAAFTAVSSAFAAPQTKTAYAHPVGSVERYGTTLVARGYAMHHVERSLGAPQLKLSADVWAFRNFNGGYEQSPDDDCTTLLVTFTNGKVTDLKLVNERAEKIYVAQLRTKSNDKIQVAAK